MVEIILNSVGLIGSALTVIGFVITISDISKIKRNKINEIETKIKDNMLKIEVAELIVKNESYIMILKDIVNKYNKDKMLGREDIIILIEKYNLIVQDLKNHENLCFSILHMIHELCDIKGIKNKYKDKENKILLDKYNGFTFIPNTGTIYLIQDTIELLEYTESIRETIDSFGYDNISDVIKIIHSYWDNKINYKKYIKERKYYIVSNSLIKSHYYELIFSEDNLKEQQNKYNNQTS